MFWSALLPLEITFYLFLSVITMITIFTPFYNWSRTKTFLISFSIAIALFIPSCTGLQIVVDTYRFGKFKYSSYSEIEDLRIKYSLPEKAKNITLYKSNSAHHVKYKISKADLLLHAGIYEEDKLISKDDFNRQFQGMNWSISKNAIKLHGVRQLNGSGSDYYYDLTLDIAYQCTAYW